KASQPARSMILACAAVGGCRTASTLSVRWISCCRRAVCGLLIATPSRGDEAVDLAVAEQPAAAELDHLVVIGAAGAGPWSRGVVLTTGPMRAPTGGGPAVEGNADVRHEREAARRAAAAPRTDVPGKAGDRFAPGRLAEGGAPGAVLGEEARHTLKPAAVQPE